MVWFGHEPLIEMLVPGISAGFAVPVPPFETGNTPFVCVSLSILVWAQVGIGNIKRTTAQQNHFTFMPLVSV